MSVLAYVGLPGSGKSYGVTCNVILPALEKKRHVFTNIPLNLEAFVKRHPEYLEFIHLFDNDEFQTDEFFTDRFIPGAVLVLDEAWRHFPSGMSASRIPEFHKTFFAEHRHLVGSDGRETDIVLVTQDLGQLCSFATLLVETVFQSVKLTAVGSDKQFRVDIFAGRKLSEKNKIRSEISSYDPAIFEFYKSHTKSEKAGKRAKVDKRETIFSWRFKAMVVFGLVAAIGGPYMVYQELQSRYMMDEDGSLAAGAFEEQSPPPVRDSSSDQPVILSVSESDVEVQSDPYFDWISSSDVFLSYNEPGRERISINGNGYSVSELLSLGVDVRVLGDCLVELASLSDVSRQPIFAECRPETGVASNKFAGASFSIGGL